MIYGGGFPGRAVGMPFAWTGRLVMDKSTPGFNIAQHMSDDGYGDPDCGPQVYIGFPSGSASLMQRIPYDYGVHNYCYWVVWFFTYALSQELSVNQALDAASLLTWSTLFGDRPLRNGFTAYWWNANPETWPNCTMAVYGNGNIFLYYYEPDFVSTPSVSGPTSGYMGTAYEFSASSMDPYGHRVRYTFDWGDGSPQTVTGWYASGAVAHASHSWNSEGVFNVKVKAQCENGAWSSWSSPHTITIGNLPTLTVYAYNQYGYPVEAPVAIDGQWVGTTPYTCKVTTGNHQIEVPNMIHIYPIVIHMFSHYYYDGNYNYNNPITLSITSDKTVIVYYDSYYYGY